MLNEPLAFFNFSALWYLAVLKSAMFWIYLWQLKEYHVGRFVDHFRTEAGRKAILDPFRIIKILLFFAIIFAGFYFPVIYFVIFIYTAESLWFVFKVAKKRAKIPVSTFKTILISAVCLVLLLTALFIFFGSPDYLILFDIALPFAVSGIVLLTHPFFVLIRNLAIKRATIKIKGFKGLTVIAITGSYGKTSTKEFLYAILSKKYNVLTTKEHQNSEIGIAKCILKNLHPGHQVFIAEVGAYNKGKVAEVCKMLMPKIGIVTGVNQQHLALFGSMENLLSAEGGEELANSLPENGLLVANGDNKYCMDLLKKNSHLPASQEKIYAAENKSANADVFAEDIEAREDGVLFVASDKNKNMAQFKINVLGRHNVQNLLGAVLVASELGMSFGEIAEAAKGIRPEHAGMVIKQGKHGIKVIDSSYSANPDGVIADLEYLAVFPGKKAVVMPSLIELGKESGAIHEKLGRKIGQVCDLAIITSNDRFAGIKKGFLETNPGGKILFNKKPEEIFSAVTSFLKSGDAVLLEGRVPKQLIELLIK